MSEKIVRTHNYCIVKECMMPRMNFFFCKFHTDEPKKEYIEQIQIYLDPKYTFEKCSVVTNLERIFHTVNKILNKRNNINSINILQARNFFLRQREIFVENMRVSDISDIFDVQDIITIHKFIVNYNYKSCDYKCNMSLRQSMIETSREYLFNSQKRRIANLKHTDISQFKYTTSSKKYNNINNYNYNENLYREFIKFINTHNIVHYREEKRFKYLEHISMLRYDLFGIMEIDMQLFFFVIEFDEDHHFNDRKIIEKDFKKEIYALDECMSMLRIYQYDNIYDQIKLFLDNIIKIKKPIIQYSNIDIYAGRINKLEKGNNMVCSYKYKCNFDKKQMEDITSIYKNCIGDDVFSKDSKIYDGNRERENAIINIYCDKFIKKYDATHRTPEKKINNMYDRSRQRAKNIIKNKPLHREGIKFRDAEMEKEKKKPENAKKYIYVDCDDKKTEEKINIHKKESDLPNK